MSISKRFFTITLCALSLHGVASPDQVLATYQAGTVVQRELDGWCTAHGIKDPDKLESAILAIMLEKTVTHDMDRNQPRFKLKAQLQAGAFALRKHRQIIYKRINPDPKQFEAQIVARLPSKDRPKRIRLRNLHKRFPPGATAEAKETMRKQMAQLLEQLKSGADFATLALRHSDSQTRFNQGILGNVRPGQLPSELAAEVWQLKPGEFSRVFESKVGLTLFKCEKHFSAVPRSEAEFRQRMVSRLTEQKRRTAWLAFQKELLQGADVVYHWDRLNQSPEVTLCEFKGRRISLGHYRDLLRTQGLSLAKKTPMRVAILNQYISSLLAIDALQAYPAHVKQLEQAQPWWQLRAMYDEALERRVLAIMEPPEEATIVALYQRYQDQLKEPAQYKLQVLRMPLKPADKKRTYDLMTQIHFDISQDKLSFADAARRYSDHPSAEDGGHIGWVAENELVNMGINLVRAARFYAPGDDIGLIEVDQAFLWLMKLEEKKPARKLTYAEAKPKVIKKVNRMRRPSYREQVIEQLLSELKPQFSEAFSAEGDD